MKFSIPRGGIPQIEGDASWIRAEGVRVAGRELPPVLIRLGVDADDRLVATGILIEADGELHTQALRLPLAGIVAEFVAELSKSSKSATYKRLYAELFGRTDLDKDPRWDEWLVEAPEGPLGLAADFVASGARTQPARRARRVPPGRRGHPDSYYRMIARRYALAKRQDPRKPILLLMDELGYSEAQVHRLIRKAREKGFIKTTKEDN